MHAPTEISDIKFAGPCQDSIVCAGRRFILKVLDASTFETTRENQLIQSELTALQVGQDHIWVGTGNGRLLQLNPKDLSILSSKQLHKDCISGILETGNEFVTIGFDGLVNFIDKRNEGVFRSLYVDSPPKQILKFKD